MKPIATNIAASLAHPIGLGAVLSAFSLADIFANGFTMSSGNVTFSEGGIVLDGSQSLERTLDGFEKYFDLSKAGFCVMVVAPYELPNATTDQFLFSASEGNSSPQIATRIYRDDGGAAHKFRKFVSASSGAGSSSYSRLEAQIGVYDFFAVVWESGGNASLITDWGVNTTAIGTFDPSEFSKIVFGDDHNGGAQFKGTIAKISMGNQGTVPSTPQMIKESYIAGDVVFAVEGQSYNFQISSSHETSEAVGMMAVHAEASELLPAPNKAYVIQASDSGSALLTSSDTSDAWLDNSGDTIVADQRQADSLLGYAAKNIAPNGVWWAQFQGDVFDIASGNTTLAEYEAGLQWKYDDWRARFGENFVIILEIPGGRNEAVSDIVDQAHQDMRELYLDFIAEHDDVIGIDNYDIPYADTTGHPTDAGQVTRCKRATRLLIDALGDEVENTYSRNKVIASKIVGSTGWDYNNDTNSWEGDGAVGFLTHNPLDITDGETYRVTYEVTGYSGGGIRPILYANNKAGVGTTRTANGVYTQDITVSITTGTAGVYMVFQATSAFTGSINVKSIKVQQAVVKSVHGPAVASIVNADTATTVTVTHDKGTDFNTEPTGGYEGFAVFDADGSRLSVSDVSRASATSLTITHASPSGATIDVKYPYGALEGVTQANLAFDNFSEPMPLQSFVQTVVVV